MPVLAMAVPMPPRKTEALEQRLGEAKNHPDLDVLAVISVCPDDISPMNDHTCKAIKIQIF